MSRVRQRPKRKSTRKKGQGFLFETIGFLALLGTAVITWQPGLITQALENSRQESSPFRPTTESRDSLNGEPVVQPNSMWLQDNSVAPDYGRWRLTVKGRR